MNIAGIDYSTQAVDIVTVPYDTDGQPDWHRYPLQGDGAFERARDVANELPGRNSMFWDDILAVGIEHPGGRNRDATLRLQGAILSVIPARMLMVPLPPGKWKKMVVGKGNADRRDYMIWVLENEPVAWDWNEDACAAYCIALATSSLITPTVAA